MLWWSDAIASDHHYIFVAFSVNICNNVCRKEDSSMKEKIYTIPLNEAFDDPGECPFCRLFAKLERDILDYILGPSYMEEDIREETNKYGFCNHHYDKMFHGGNHLGVALMVSTHLKKINKDLNRILSKELAAKKKRGLFKKHEASSPLAEYTENLSDSCYACMRMDGRMKNYIDTFFYMWRKEPAFRDKVLSCNGFCLEHFSKIIGEAQKRMSQKDFSEFIKAVIPLQGKNLARIAEELDWFIQKFDYRFQNESWKNSKDAPERAILKISSLQIED